MMPLQKELEACILGEPMPGDLSNQLGAVYHLYYEEKGYASKFQMSFPTLSINQLWSL